MQIAKKYFTEGLIQLTILLSLIGVRVDVDSYLGGYFSPLLEISLGPSSAYTQTPFHSPRDTINGYSVHPKCPELDHFFASRRLLDEVRSLGSPRFPTQLDAWLVHQAPETDGSTDVTDVSPGLEEEEAGPEDEHEPGRALRQVDDLSPAAEEAASPGQLAHSSTLEHAGPHDGSAGLSDPATVDIDRHWSHFLSLPVSDLDDLDPLVMERLAGLDPDIAGAISQDVSLRDAMVTAAGGGARPVARLRAPAPPLFRLGSANSSHSDLDLGLAASPFPPGGCDLARGVSGGGGGGCLDEAVFDQINLLGLEGLDPIGTQLLGGLGGLEEMDSDSGLSLESSSRGPASPGASEVSSSSSSSSSYCEDECGAAGYSSEGDALPSKGVAALPPRASPPVWHDHSYSSPPAWPDRGVKEEPQSGDEEEEEEEEEARDLSRDELRARAMCIPFSALQIVNMPVEEFLEVLDGRGLSPQQATLLRDIRRRGKNKLAAQNCRRRKLDAISGLQGEVARLQAHRERLLTDKRLTAKTLGAVGHQIRRLTRDVLSRLRDGAGRPLSPDAYTLRCGADGRVAVQPVRRPAVAAVTAGSKTDKRKKDKKP